MLPPKKANTRYQGIPHVRVQLYHTVTDIITAASSGRKIVRKKSRTPTYNTFRGIANSKNLKPRRTHRLEERQLPVPSTAAMPLAREGAPPTHLDREQPRSRGSERGTNKGGAEEETGLFGLVLLSASMDGSIRAWETLGKSEKYCMRHPASEEATTMVVLPGGSVLATGGNTSRDHS